MKNLVSILERALESRGPVKFEINGRYEPYFGTVREISPDACIVEYHDCVARHEFVDISNVIV